MTKQLCVLIAVLFLIGCVPEYRLPAGEVKEKHAPQEEVVPEAERVIPYPYTKVWQQRGNQTILWGYDQKGRLILLNGSDTTVVLTYSGDTLMKIDDGVKPLKLYYDREKLSRVEKGIQNWIFTYTAKGKLVGVESSGRLTVTHDSKGRLSSVTRDGGVSTEFEYDELNRTKAMFKNKVTTAMSYDSEGRLKLLSRQDDHLVIAYWREDLLSSLSGTMYGLKETVNYGPTAITLVSNVEQNEFSSTYADESAARTNAFNTFLFCTRFRLLPVLFDGQSWVLYHEYLRGNITDYLLTSFLCDYLP